MGITFIEANSNVSNETMTVNELIDWLEIYKDTYNAGETPLYIRYSRNKTVGINEIAFED